MYKIVISEKAFKQLEKLDKQVQEQIIKGLEKIRIRPESFVKRLVGMEGYRLRVGDYRVILDIEKETLVIFVIKVGHRKNIYK